MFRSIAKSCESNQWFIFFWVVRRGSSCSGPHLHLEPTSYYLLNAYMQKMAADRRYVMVEPDPTLVVPICLRRLHRKEELVSPIPPFRWHRQRDQLTLHSTPGPW